MDNVPKEITKGVANLVTDELELGGQQNDLINEGIDLIHKSQGKAHMLVKHKICYAKAFSTFVVEKAPAVDFNCITRGMLIKDCWRSSHLLLFASEVKSKDTTPLGNE